MCVVKSLTTQTPTILNRTTHKHNTISKQLKHNSLLQLSFFLAQLRYMGIEQGDCCKGGCPFGSSGISVYVLFLGGGVLFGSLEFTVSNF